MGYANRKKKALIEAGVIKSISQTVQEEKKKAEAKPLMLICHACGNLVSASGVRSHIESC